MEIKRADPLPYNPNVVWIKLMEVNKIFSVKSLHIFKAQNKY